MLAIDIGNSRIKWALYSGEPIELHMQSYGVISYTNENLEAELSVASFPVATSAIEVSCVASEEIKHRLMKWLGDNNANHVNFAKTQAKQGGITNSYQHPLNMGVDRWLAMMSAFKLNPTLYNECVCVIDCGTAITLDVIDVDGKHLGGVIMPGFQAMIQSLVSNTGNIESAIENPGTEKCYKGLTEGLANSTQASISKGCAQLIVGGLSNIIKHYQISASVGIKCIVTGGDGEWVSNALNLSQGDAPATVVEISYNPYLVLQGLVIASSHVKP